MDKQQDKRLSRRPAWSRKVYHGECCVYVAVEMEGSPRYLKIGVARDCDKRLRARTDNPREIWLAGLVRLPTRARALLIETYLHHRFSAWFKRGEWFGVGVDDIDAMAREVVRSAQEAAADPLLGDYRRRFDVPATVDPSTPPWWGRA